MTQEAESEIPVDLDLYDSKLSSNANNDAEDSKSVRKTAADLSAFTGQALKLAPIVAASIIVENFDHSAMNYLTFAVPTSWGPRTTLSYPL